MPAALEEIRTRLDRGLGRAPAAVPTLDTLKARIDRGMGRSTPLPRRKPPRASKDLIEAMIEAESRGDPNAVSSAGAQGLMQITPATAKDLDLTDPFDPVENRAAGTRYINTMFARYGGDPELGLTRFRGHLMSLEKGVHDAKDKTTIFVRVPRADGRTGPRGSLSGGTGPGIRAVCPGNP